MAGPDGDGDAVGHRQGATLEDGQGDQRVLGESGLGDEEHGQQDRPMARVDAWSGPSPTGGRRC